MPKEYTSLQSFNRGKISRLALARTDIRRTNMSAEVMTNWMPRILGSMMLRPGLGYIGSTYNDLAAKYIGFVPSTDENDLALLELTDMAMRVRDYNEAIISRPSVSTAFTNGTFNTDLTGWSDDDQSGATSSWLAGGYMSLVGTRYNSAIRRQTLTVSGSDQNVEHGLRVTITRGQVTLRVGTSSGGDELITATTLLPGTHSLAFTPTGASAYVELSATTQYASLVDSIAIESAGDMVIPTIWSASNLANVRYTQSIDVLFCACKGKRQQRIERRGVRSWSVVDYIADDGPFRTENTSAITLTAGALTGDTTLTASQKLFRSTNVGSLFKLTSIGQTVTDSFTGEGQFGNYIKVIGTGTSRNFTINRSGTWSATITVQRSIGEPGAWADTTTTYTTNGSATYNDSLDNQIIFYRVGIKTGAYTSGTATVTLTYDSGGLTGIARVTSYTSELLVNVSVLQPFGSTTATGTWSEGAWSDRRGFPTTPAIYEGRLWWAGKDKIFGSISDAFASFDDTQEGDSAPISRSIGEGPVDTINWMLPLKRLVVGAQASEKSARSSSFDELLTATNFNIKDCSTYGSGPIAAAKMDSNAFFVEQGSRRLLKLTYDATAYDYDAEDMVTLIPEQCSVGIIAMDIQRRPDTRVHCVLADGTAGVMVYDQVEDVICWIDVETDGFIEGVVTLPSAPEDRVYYVVKRTINGSDKRFLERWASESDCVGGLLNKQADSFVVYDSTPTTSIPVAHLEGETVVVWSDGVDVGTKTVSGGVITLDAAASKVVAGLSYEARYKSAKLAYAAAGGTPLNRKKKLTEKALTVDRTHCQGIKVGRDFDHLRSLPLNIRGKNYAGTEILDQEDFDLSEFNGDWDTDSRLCIRAAAPRPATILCATIGVETNG
jgi:hypothetical protein